MPLKPEFKQYQKQVLSNAQTLASALIRLGFKLVSDGTDNHLMLVDLRSFGITGRRMQELLDAVYITANKNKVPNDPESAFVTSGLRLGTPAVTSRGFKNAEMEIVAEFLYLAASNFDANADKIRSEVVKLCEKYPIY